MAFVQPFSLPRTGLSHGSTAICSRPTVSSTVSTSPLEIQAAKHAQFKAAKKANRKRPKKHRPSDINRKPPPYNTNPLLAEGIPEPYTIVSRAEPASEDASASDDASTPAEETQVPVEA